MERTRSQRRALVYQLAESLGFCCPLAMFRTLRHISTLNLSLFLGVNVRTVRYWKRAIHLPCPNNPGCTNGLTIPPTSDMLTRIARKAPDLVWLAPVLSPAPGRDVGEL